MLVPIQLPPGLERNGTPYDTPERWWDMSQVRWQSNTIRPIGGWNRLTGAPLDSAIRKFHVYRDNSGSRHVLVGTDNKLYADDGGYMDITPTAFVPLSEVGTAGGYGTFDYGEETYGDARSAPSPVFAPYAYWTFDNWGEDVILTANSDGRLFYYTTSTASTPPAVITDAPTGNSAVYVTEERHVMVFGTGGFPFRVAWSSREDFEDWDFDSTTNTAGFQDLNTHTPLLKGVGVREGVLIFSSSEVFLAQYIGQPYIYSFSHLGDASMMHPDSVATFDGKAVWLSRRGFNLYNGGFVQPLDCPILNDILGDFDPTYGTFRAHAANNGLFPEVWFFYCSTGNTECNRYVIWNYLENWWAWGSLSRSAMAPANAFKLPYMGAGDGNIYQHEDGWLNAGVSRVGDIWIESGALGIGNGDKTMNIKQVLANNGFGYQSVNATFYTKLTPEGAERTFGPYTMRSDGYMDVRVAGREGRVKWAAAADGDWAIGKSRFDIIAGTGR